MFMIYTIVHLASWTKLQEYDTHLITSPLKESTKQEDACKDLGYDGLAIVNTPEQFAYTLELVNDKCFNKGIAVYVGLHYDTDLKQVIWNDGNTDVPIDMPGAESLTIASTEPHGRITPSRALKMGSGVYDQCALCGNRNPQFRHAQGVSESGKQPDGVSSILTSQVNNHGQCIGLCGRDVMCRAAEFNSDLLTCRLFGPGSYSGLVSNNSTKTFVRMSF